MSVALGGHPLPLIVRRAGTVESLGTASPIVGWRSESVYTSANATLAPGDMVVMYTDGLLEAIAGRGETDDQALRALLGPLAGRPAEETAQALDAAIGDERGDDVAVMVTRVL
jgi:sigma-B regulation protein RsbU (phosphoserine phosphatase)